MLWNENRQLWNVSHFLLCVTYMMKVDWETGIRILFASPTTKIIIMSVNDVDAFEEIINRFSQDCIAYSHTNANLFAKLKDIMFCRPYYFFCFFVEMISQLP